ncbi:MAG: AEC family transporter [Clostridiales bacterium]|nr:AEC family transporter [Clostridiales bacterium]
MDITNLLTLQCTMFLLAGIGVVLKRTGVLPDSAKGILTDFVLYFILPCNIINSFRVEFDRSILGKFAVVLGVSVLVQALSYTLSKLLYNHKPAEVKRVMQYCTIVSNSGFLGLPIAESIYGAEGMMYASVFIIPMRIMMWSAGISCFTESPDLKSVVKKLVVHPCIVAVYIGLGLMIFQNPLNQFLTAIPEGTVVGMAVTVVTGTLSKVVRSAGNCTTTLTMILIGMMLAEVHPREMLNTDAWMMTGIRLLLIPGVVFLFCRAVGLPHLLGSICVLMTAMPAGSTSAILAAKYGCDYTFASKCIVISTLLSLLSTPVWVMILG